MAHLKMLRRKAIWEALHPNSGNTLSTIPDRGPGRPKEFASDTAAAAGMTKQAINQHLARAEALGDDLDKVTGTIKNRLPSQKTTTTEQLKRDKPL